MDSAENPLPIETSCQAVHAAQANGDDFLLLDCRDPEEYALVRIPNARLLPLGELPVRAAELEPYRNRRIVVHCHHGGRSLRAANWLRANGFPQAQSMAGGIDTWAEQIDPTLPRY
jgi:rhodanese-related sulfurtransferase